MYHIICPKCGKVTSSWPEPDGIYMSKYPCDRCARQSGKSMFIYNILFYGIIFVMLYFAFRLIF